MKRKTLRRIKDDPRYRCLSYEQVRAHFEVERELRKRILISSPAERAEVIRQAYQELFERVPWHPAISEVERSQPNEPVIEKWIARWRGILGDNTREILELGFGSGESLLALARLGHRAFGIDVELSRVEAMLARTAEEERIDPTLSDSGS